MITILYYTDGSVREPLASAVLERLAGTGLPIVKERNDVKERSHLQLFRNIQRGLFKVTTPFVAMAEHDCFYPDEHFFFVPPRTDVFYYNENVRYLRLNKLQYHTPYKRRKALSGLVCSTDLLRSAVNQRVSFLENGGKIVRGTDRTEFGFNNDGFESGGFATEAPYLDIRHGKNYSGLRKGKYRTFNERYWGEFTRWIQQ